MAGYSGTPLAKKLGLTGEVVFTVVGAPPGFAESLAEELGDDTETVWQRTLLSPLDVVVAFHTSRDALGHGWPKLTAAMSPAGGIWVVWPKRTGGVATDITEDVLRELLLPTGWVDNKVCAVDDTWSALRFVLRRELRPGAREGKRPGDRR